MVPGFGEGQWHADRVSTRRSSETPPSTISSLHWRTEGSSSTPRSAGPDTRRASSKRLLSRARRDRSRPRRPGGVRADLAAYADRVRLVRGDFQDLAAILERLGVASVRGVLLDLGVSSPQLDEPHRGFSFRNDGPLDMRMDPAQPLSAEDVVNTYPEADLARVISRYGEERFARRIAKAIVRSRPVSGTRALAEIVKEAIPAATRRTGGHPARRTFQAIRIEVNGELDALEHGPHRRSSTTPSPAAVSS